MNKILNALLCACLFAVSGFSVTTWADVQEFSPSQNAQSKIPELESATVYLKPDRVFTPMSLDDQHKAQILLDGSLPSYCYYLVKPYQRVEADHKRIFVSLETVYHPSSWCVTDAPMPYTITLDLGHLEAGQYEIYTEGEGLPTEKISTLPISISAHSQNENTIQTSVSDLKTYCLVNCLKDENTRDHKVTLNIRYDNSRVHYSGTEVRVYPNHVIELAPQLKPNNEGPCTPQMVTMKATVQLKDLPVGRYLLHVRMPNGAAYNTVMDL